VIVVFTSGFSVAQRTSEDLNKRCWTFFLSFLSIHRAQQPRRGRPSKVFRTFGRRWSFINWPRDLAHPPLIFSGAKKFGQKFGLIFFTSLNFEPLAFEGAARNLNSETKLLRY